ncbi:MAG: TetR/AcrR family transcriptional regulator, partial [Tepidiformaceae bacterium]
MTHVGERADARANRDRVVRAARAVFAERGSGAEIREIAERAGVGMGTVYRNFANRDDLMAAIIGECIDEANAMMDRAETAPTPLEGLQALLAGGWHLVEIHGD